MMWGSDYPHSESTFPQSRKIRAEILAGVPDDEQAKIAGGNTARVCNFDVARLSSLLEEPISLRIDEVGVAAIHGMTAYDANWPMFSPIANSRVGANPADSRCACR